MIKNLVFFIIISSTLYSCASVQNTGNTELPKIDPEAKSLLESVQEMNKSRPQFVKAYVSVNGSFKKNKFKANGVAYLQENPAKAKVILNDLVFKSPMLYIVADKNEVKTYFPVEKTALISTGDFSNLTLLSSDPDTRLLLAHVLSVKVPLLHSYNEVSYVKENNRQTVTLIGDTIVEELTFKKGSIYKAIIKNSDGKRLYSVYYGAKIEKEGYTFFQSIRAVSPQERLLIYFGNISVNPELKRKPNFHLAIPKDAKVFR